MSLPGSERYAHPWSSRPTLRRGSEADIIEQANTIPVIRVLRDHFGLLVPDGLGERSWKTYCPFRFEHPDGGVDKGFRVYEVTNSSYCFVLHGRLTPVRLISIKRDCRHIDAGKWLLLYYDLNRPRPYWERFRELANSRLQRSERQLSPAYSVEALQVALSQVPGYAQRQFDPDIVAALDSELELLDHVTPDEARQWFDQATHHLITVIQEGTENG